MEDRVQYVCSECRFKFRRLASKNEIVCPNCGRDGGIERADTTINKMINDAGDMFD